jgi:5-formyltetrahydrofolate cyclo-ligase
LTPTTAGNEAVEDVSEEKESLRKRLRAERAAIAPAELRASSEACCRNAAPLLSRAKVVAFYAATRGEIDPAQLVAGVGRAVWPRVDGATMSFREGPLEPGRFDIPAPREHAPAVAPDEIDLVFVPGLAFDDRGHRLGYGRGYYDAALAAAPRAVRVGLCHAFQRVDRVPLRPGDEPVDYLVTPDGVVPTGARFSKETP